MPSHTIVSREEWREARTAHLAKEKEFTRLRDQLSAERRALPWVKVDKTYVFEGPAGKTTLAELFDGRRQLIVYHFMFGPGWEEGCPSCSFLADHIYGAVRHLVHRDVTLLAVSRAPLGQIEAFKKRMGWRFTWVSSHGTDFNFDYHVSFTKDQSAKGAVDYNFAACEFPSEEAPGISVFYKTEHGEVFHTYSAYARGLDMLVGTHLWYDGTPRAWEFARVWHLEPSLTDPDTVYAGVQDAALFRSVDGAQTWQELPGLRGHTSAPLWQPGAGGLCLHTIVLDPSHPERIFIAISAAGVFRSDDAGKTWQPMNRGLRSEQIPDPTAEVGHCVHRIAMHRSRPGVLFMQKHWDVMRSDDAGESWREISGNLPTDFGFPIDVHAHEPDTIYVVPIKSDSEHYVPDARLRVYRSRTGGNEWEPLTKGLPQRDCYLNVLRDAMTIDSLDSCGVYFGTTGGQVYASPDAGDTWTPIIRDLPAVLSVEAQTLP